MTPEIEQFLRQLLRDAGQVNLSPELETQMLKDLYGRLEDHLIYTALDNLTEDQQEEFERMAEAKKDPAELQMFLQKCIPDYQKVFANSLLDFRNLYLSGGKI